MSNPNVRTLPTPLGLGDFEIGVTLGTGSFGRVRIVTHKVHLYADSFGLIEVSF